MWKKRLQTAGWCTLGLMAIVLLVMGVRAKSKKVCSDIQIEIDSDQAFVDKSDVMRELNNNHIKVGDAIAAIPLRVVEEKLNRYSWVKNAQLFIDNNQALHVNIEEREPLARVFTLQGTSFYIDSAGKQLPLSSKMTLRVPMFTSFPNGGPRLSAGDSAVLKDIEKIAVYIQSDSFWKAMVSQIDIKSNRTYEMIPVIGNQVITLGDTSRLKEKFENLYCFYRQVWSKTGFEKYGKLDARFVGQIVAVEKGAYKNGEVVVMDTTATVRQEAIATTPVVPTPAAVIKKKPPKAKKHRTENNATVAQVQTERPKAVMPKLKKKKKR